MSNDLTRLETRFLGEPEQVEGARARVGNALEAEEAEELGLVTYILDDIDWEDEVRIFLEERASFSPDAMTGMEANLRFRRPRNDGDTDFRPSDGLAELDLSAPQRGRAGRCAATLRSRAYAANTTWNASEMAPTAPHCSRRQETMLDLINVSYDTQIPNNVGLSSDKKVLKALEKWHPGYINWWNDLIPQNFQESHGLSAHGRVGGSERLGQIRLREDAGIPLGCSAGTAG